MKKPPLQTVDRVDLERYAGRWYEVARYPAFFERKCERNVTADYALRPNGTVRVENRCLGRGGRTNRIEGTARVVDPSTNAKLKVKFGFFIPAGDYWVIDLDPEYRWAVVGEPKRRFLWILSRTPILDDATFQKICERLRQQSYAPEALIRTQQDHS